MPEPRIEILGVYRPHIPEDVYQEQWQVTGSDEDTKEHFDSLVLIEAIIHDVNDQFKIIKIGQQPPPSNDPKYFQVPYDEALLSSDGETLIQRKMNCVHGTGSLRFAFYLHLLRSIEAALNWLRTNPLSGYSADTGSLERIGSLQCL